MISEMLSSSSSRSSEPRIPRDDRERLASAIADDAVTERHRVHADVEQLWSELSDHCQVDAVLEFRKRVVSAWRRCGARRRQSLVQFHQRLLEDRRSRLRGPPRASFGALLLLPSELREPAG